MLQMAQSAKHTSHQITSRGDSKSCPSEDCLKQDQGLNGDCRNKNERWLNAVVMMVDGRWLQVERKKAKALAAGSREVLEGWVSG